MKDKAKRLISQTTRLRDPCCFSAGTTAKGEKNQQQQLENKSKKHSEQGKGVKAQRLVSNPRARLAFRLIPQ